MSKSIKASRSAVASAFKASPLNVPPFNVPLSRLVPSPNNVRRYQSDAGIGELVASMSASGQIQDMRVREGEKGKLFVVAGSRRLKALHTLQKIKNGSIKGKRVTGNFLVRVSYQEEDDDDTEVSLAENHVRQNMHPADAAEAFLALHEQGRSPEHIADRFGISHMTVRRRLKLAKVSPILVAAFREDKLTLEQMEALAVTDDHTAQEEAIHSATASWELNPQNLKNRLTHEALRGNDRMVKFITLDAYVKAGGAILRDLFASEETVFLTNRALVCDLAAAKMQSECAVYQGQGWKWVEGSFDSQPSGYRRIHAKRFALSDDDSAKMAALEEAYRVEEAGREDVDEDDEDAAAALVAKLDAIGREMNALQEPYIRFDEAEMDCAGVLLCLDYNGVLDPHFGMVKPQDVNALVRLQQPEPVTHADGDADEAETTPEEPITASTGLPMAVVEDLTALRTMALGLALSERPDVALCVALHPLTLQAFYNSGHSYPSLESACQIRNTRPQVRLSQTDSANSGAFAADARAFSAWKSALPESQHGLWPWLLEQKQPFLMKLFAYLISQSVNAWQQRHEGIGRQGHGNAIAEAVGLDMHEWWKPSEGFFKRVPKNFALEVMREQGAPAALVKGMEKDNKADAIINAVEFLGASDWLPEPLRLHIAEVAVSPVEVEICDAGFDDQDEGAANDAA
jgi:ParB family transcriptional regulator, chromosome partitioning protein